MHYVSKSATACASLPSNSVGVIVGGVIAGIVVLCVIIALICCCIKKQGHAGRVVRPNTQPGTGTNVTVVHAGTNTWFHWLLLFDFFGQAYHWGAFIYVTCIHPLQFVHSLKHSRFFVCKILFFFSILLITIHVFRHH